MAFGASVLDPALRIRASDEEWQLAKAFKMHLHPKTMKEAHNFELTRLYPTHLLMILSDDLSSQHYPIRSRYKPSTATS